jgi:hypothetical protein
MLPDSALDYGNVLPEGLFIGHPGVPQKRIGEAWLYVFVRHSIPSVRLSLVVRVTRLSTSPPSIIQRVMHCGISANSQ